VIFGEAVSISFREKFLPDGYTEVLDEPGSLEPFPSLSERSSFLTGSNNNGEDNNKRIVSISFREKFLPDRFGRNNLSFQKVGLFPSLSERSSFLTRANRRSVIWLELVSFHLFQREVPS